MKKLISTLKTLPERSDIVNSLAAFGLTERFARALLHSKKLSPASHALETVAGDEGEGEQSGSSGGGIENSYLQQLFGRWCETEAEEIQYAQILKTDAPQTSSQSYRRTLSPPWDYKAIQIGFSAEGPRSMERLAVQSFLDKIQSQSEEFIEDAIKEGREDADEIQRVQQALTQLHRVRSTMDMHTPTFQFHLSRTMIRQIHLHVGPTNSGKTHGALLALCKARTGVFAGPLRLLAHEVWDRINSGTVSPGVEARACNLVTGEEVQTVDPFAGLTSCTVEMCPLDSPVDVAVIDEIQMIADSQRGYAWTNAVLGVPAKEVHLCGEASVIPLIRKLAKACGDELHVHDYKRLTPLKVADESLQGDLGLITKGDCVVTFARSKIFALKRSIESKTGLRCAIAYGGLPPETRSEQAKLFNDPDSGYDVMVASDAIGMGLNL